MKDRITQFLKIEGITPAEFADKIGVQRSSVSHVLNGRNYPSASFIQKMLVSYTTLNSRWLLLGEGPVFDATFSPLKEQLLFQLPDKAETPKSDREKRPETTAGSVTATTIQPTDNIGDNLSSGGDQKPSVELKSPLPESEILNYIIENKEVERIVFFFKDKTFSAYTPSK